MRNMLWKSDYCVGIETIDQQHRKIFEHLLAIENALEKKDPGHVLNFLIAQLLSALTLHLTVEDALLEIVDYPHRQEHLASHASLEKAMAQLQERLRNNGTSQTLVDFFERWFVNHVLSEDREFAAYLQARLASTVRAPSAALRRPSPPQSGRSSPLLTLMKHKVS